MNRPSKYGSSVDYEKPRRLEEETALYLLQLEEQLDAKNEDIEILINNVLDEIKQRVASTFCDKRTNYLLEKICYLSNMRQLLDIMNRCQAYVIFLSQNRYGSHVVQVSQSSSFPSSLTSCDCERRSSPGCASSSRTMKWLTWKTKPWTRRSSPLFSLSSTHSNSLPQRSLGVMSCALRSVCSLACLASLRRKEKDPNTSMPSPYRRPSSPC
jgi:hypothetical protein